MCGDRPTDRSVNVFSGAPFGNRYLSKVEGGGEARSQVVLEQARVVREMIEWIATERASVNEVVRRLTRRGIVGARTGMFKGWPACVWPSS